MTPTQSRHPWRATLRTVFAGLVAVATLLPVAAAAGGVDTVPAVAQAITVAAAITRLLALPAVDDFLRRFAPWLAASPSPTPDEPYPY